MSHELLPFYVNFATNLVATNLLCPWLIDCHFNEGTQDKRNINCGTVYQRNIYLQLNYDQALMQDMLLNYT